jgi:hypothetical protein
MELTLIPQAQGQGTKIVMVAATPGRFLVTKPGHMVLTPDAQTFICRGTVTTNAAADVDQILLANNQVRVGPFAVGEYLCYFSTPGGNMWLMQEG